MTTFSEPTEYACPRCGNTDRLDVVATIWARITPDGTDADLPADNSHEWNNDSACRCAACGHTSEVRNFQVKK